VNSFKGISMLRVVLSQRWRTLSKTERLVMVSLIARSKSYQCWPSFNEIAADMGLERRAVMRAVTALRRAGHVSIWTREGMRNKYSVSLWRDPDQCTQNTLVRHESTSEQKIHEGVYTEDTSSLHTHCLPLKAAEGQA
jgi:DNA-binding transcriptional ArsR family regulator